MNGDIKHLQHLKNTRKLIKITVEKLLDKEEITSSQLRKSMEVLEHGLEALQLAELDYYGEVQ